MEQRGRESRVNYRRLPQYLVAVGFLLAVTTVVEVVGIVRAPVGFGPAAIANVVTSVPFVAFLVGAGYWLSGDGPSADRYRRIAAWSVAGSAFFLAFFVVIAAYEVTHWTARLGVLRWALSIGLGLGTLVGVLEARAIDRERLAERSRVRATELERQNERLEEFAGTLSHDIRNPLNVVEGRIELAREEHDSEHLDAAADALERVEGMVERTLTLARSGRIIGEVQRVDLDDIVGESWRNVETGRADLRVETLPVAEADPDRLRHVFENLFRNSVEHGGPGVTVAVGPLEDGFYVEDDGPGIPEAEHDAILDDGSAGEEGSGFGLTIVRQVVDAHGWDLVVTDGSDGGARFEVTGVTTVPRSDRASTPVAEGPT
ncbi:MAG: sensor histidine kinase [Haloferacaceae archaeon]